MPNDNLYGYSDEQLEGLGRNPISWRGTPQEEAALEAYLKKKERLATAGTQQQSGREFADRMRQRAEQTPASFRVDHTGIDQARQLSAQSYANQQKSLGLMRAMAQGQGPSAAALQQGAAQDAAMNQMTGASGGNLRSALMSGGMQNIATQAGRARGQEIGAAQQGWAQAGNTMRGQSLQDYGQGLSNAYGANKLALAQMGQNLEREMKLQGLSLGGLTSDAAYQNAMLDAQLGYYGNEVDREMASRNAALQGMSAAYGGVMKYGMGGSPGGGSPSPNYRDRSQWAPGSEDYYSDRRVKY